MDADVIIIGAGISGMATATRLQARGLRTLTLEAHSFIGGCAGFFRRKGFAFDVGATTLVDFESEGVGGQWLSALGLDDLPREALPGYRAWLPDREITLHRDTAAWHAERLRALGDTLAHRRFWALLDRLAHVFWRASRRGIRMPLRGPSDVAVGARAIGLRGWPLVRYLRWTMGDALRRFGLERDANLRSLLGMLIQDTVHSSVDDAPLINSALGVTIRGAGLMRAHGGMYGFWRAVLERHQELGGEVRIASAVSRVTRRDGLYEAHTRRGVFRAPQLISTLPLWNSARLGLPEVEEALRPFMERDADALGGAIVAFLGVPEAEVEGQEMTHHQLLVDHDAPLGDGNNMFISISSPGDTLSAPAGHRAVMLSTHCELSDWEGLSEADYAQRKAQIGARLLDIARRVYPRLGEAPVVHRVGTPRTYETFTRRWRGAVGGARLTLANSNQRAVPHDIGPDGFWQAGDTTWPGLGTVACVLSSAHIATGVERQHQRINRRRRAARPALLTGEPTS